MIPPLTREALESAGRTFHAAERFPQVAAQDGVHELKNELSYVSGWISLGWKALNHER